MSSDRPIGRRIRETARGVLYLQSLIGNPVTLLQAIGDIQTRLARRPDIFLDTLERTVFAHAKSPYRPLLDAAGHTLARLRALVAREGIEGALRRLCADGVYVSVEEFKGLREARRGDHVWRFNERDFINPISSSGVAAASGGTRTRPVQTAISPANFRLGATHLAVALAAYRVESQPGVVWLPVSHGASLWSVVTLAELGRPVSAWFGPFPISGPGRQRIPAFYRIVRAWARLRGIKLPAVTYVPFGKEERILDWIRRTVGEDGCVVLTTPSNALRLALAAARQRVGLRGVTFITLGEPLTPTKLAAIHDAGARAFSSLGFTEFGRATYGCASPIAPDETHLCRDAVAVIQRNRVVDRMGSTKDVLLFTSLLPNARRTLLNMETGDYARLSNRRCGCPLDALGWIDHLQDIRSFEKLNAEGRLFFGSELISLVEQRLPERFGGDPTDYQLVEEEDHSGLTRLSVYVHPRLGPVDEDAVQQCVEAVLGDTGPAATVVWRQASTVQVRRVAPAITNAGKLMPLHHLGVPAQSPAGAKDPS